MKHVTKLEDAQIEQPSIVTIGMFDGVHRGHQKLIKQLVDEAHRTGFMAVVLTFFPHPDVILRGLQGRYYLISPQQRAEILHGLGVDVVVTQPFDDTLRTVRAKTYVERLSKHLNMKSLWVGRDFAMGYQREGNVAYLTELGTQLGYDVNSLDLVTYDDNGQPITSTAIREFIKLGKIDKAQNYLNRSYSIQGEVVQGDQRGRLIGFPTANMAVWDEQLLPRNGVYACWVTLNDERYMAVANVGVRPTFDGSKEVVVEPHILDFDRDIYGKQITLTLESRLRDEMKFDGIESLKTQLQQDIQTGREILMAQG